MSAQDYYSVQRPLTAILQSKVQFMLLQTLLYRPQAGRMCPYLFTSVLFEGLRYRPASLEIRHTSRINVSIVLTPPENFFKVLHRHHDNPVLVSQYKVAGMHCNGWKSFFWLRGF